MGVGLEDSGTRRKQEIEKAVLTAEAQLLTRLLHWIMGCAGGVLAFSFLAGGYGATLRWDVQEMVEDVSVLQATMIEVRDAVKSGQLWKADERITNLENAVTKLIIEHGGID